MEANLTFQRNVKLLLQVFKHLLIFKHRLLVFNPLIDLLLPLNNVNMEGNPFGAITTFDYD